MLVEAQKMFIRWFGKVRRLAKLMRYAPLAIAQLVVVQIQEHTQHQGSLGRVGSGTHIERTLSLRNPRNVFLGENVILGPNNVLWASVNAKIIIGDYALFAPNVTIVAANHGFKDLTTPINDQPESEQDVTIGPMSWLGTGVIVLSGVTIGEGAIVAAGAVVIRDVAPYEIVGGIPARRIGSRLETSS